MLSEKKWNRFYVTVTSNSNKTVSNEPPLTDLQWKQADNIITLHHKLIW